jgi:hypothetical protein
MSARWLCRVGLAAALLCSAFTAGAALIQVNPGDNYKKIEGANPGDEVVIAPGTYAFRVYLTKQATPTNPIYIHALDPANPPVWDFGTNLVDNAPGDYTAGDRARGGWQFSGAANYELSGIVFMRCRNAAANCGAIRYYETTTNLYIHHCLFVSNDVGITGGTQDSLATIEFSEFNANGNLNAPSSAPTHNIYIYGGYLAMRYCFLHDSVQGQNFHIRCRNATLEYNWFARAANYEGDLMSDDDLDGAGAGPFTELLTLRGNVFVQNSHPGNHSQVIAIFNDESIPNLTMSVRALYNTFVGSYGSSQFIHLSNADGTKMSAEISDNLIYNTTVPYYVETPAAGTVSGVNNWLGTGASSAGLTGTVAGSSPGFLNAAGGDYHLSVASACRAAANSSPYGLPGREYYYNETTNLMWRIRAAARDIGAFESTSTNAPIGPYDPPPQPSLGIKPGTNSASLTWPLFAQDYSVASSTLTAPAQWQPATYATLTNASNVTAIFTATSPHEFFRLQK